MNLVFEAIFIPLVLAFFLSLVLAIYSYLQTGRAARLFSLLMGLISLWILCYFLELASTSLEQKYFWLKAKYFASAPAPVAWLAFSLLITQKTKWLTRPVKILFWAWPVFIIVGVFTNSWHEQMWQQVELRPDENDLAVIQGPFFWVYAISVYTMILLSGITYFLFYIRASALLKPQAVYLLLGAVIPLAGRALKDVFGIQLVPKLDEVVFLLLLSGCFFAVALFRYGALRIMPLALETINDTVSGGIMVSDSALRLVYANKYAAEFAGIPGDVIRNQGVADVLPEIKAELPAISRSEITIEFQRPLAGREKHFSLRGVPVSRQKKPIGFVFVFFDITKQKENEKNLIHLSQTDDLTGIYNRRYFFESAAQSLKKSQADFSVILIDIDFFKQVNDKHGHQAGDRVLKKVASLCMGVLGEEGFLARYGGEEFVALLQGVPHQRAITLAENMRCQVEEADFETCPVSISAGVATARKTEQLEPLLKKADQALYRAKNSGRNQVVSAENLL